MLCAVRSFGRRLASSAAASPSTKNASAGSALSKRRKFYKEVGVVSEQENGVPLYKVTLDGRVLKTQGGAPLKVQSEPLALAIAEEWSAQDEFLEIGLMRLSGLAMTSTDNPFHDTRESITAKILEYLATDTVLFYDPDNERLLEAQHQHWDPVIRHANSDLGTNIRPVADLFTFEAVSKEDTRKVEAWLMSYNLWALTGMKYAVESSKSVLIPHGIIRHRLSAEEAVHLALLEQRVQAEQWGEVEWAHGLEEQELTTRFSAAALFVYLNSNTMTKKEAAA